MNHKKVIPANGISFVAVRMPPRSELSHCVESPSPSGILTRIRISTAAKSRADRTPARAAARGVVNWCRLGPAAGEGPVDEDTGSSCQTRVHASWISAYRRPFNDSGKRAALPGYSPRWMVTVFPGHRLAQAPDHTA